MLRFGPALQSTADALLNTRDCIAGDVRNGLVDLHHRLAVHDEKGEVVHQLDFAEAVKIVAN